MHAAPRNPIIVTVCHSRIRNRLQNVTALHSEDITILHSAGVTLPLMNQLTQQLFHLATILLSNCFTTMYQATQQLCHTTTRLLRKLLLHYQATQQLCHTTTRLLRKLLLHYQATQKRTVTLPCYLATVTQLPATQQLFRHYHATARMEDCNTVGLLSVLLSLVHG
jgi:hypothetical protein